MGITDHQEKGWRGCCALLCLVSLLSLSILHAAHFSTLHLPQSQGKSEFLPSSADFSPCPACVAVNSSAAEPLFHALSSSFGVHNQSLVIYESPLTPARFLRLFVRPPPSALALSYKPA